MTQKQKNLLIKDLCSRLPYGVKVLYKGEKYKISNVSICNETITIYGERGYPIEVEIKKVKPYLFPLSSITEEQKEELDKYLDMDSKSLIDGYKNGLKCAHPYFNVQDWYNKNHFDYRGLIPMGLAIDATGLNIY